MNESREAKLERELKRVRLLNDMLAEAENKVVSDRSKIEFYNKLKSVIFTEIKCCLSNDKGFDWDQQQRILNVVTTELVGGTAVIEALTARMI